MDKSAKRAIASRRSLDGIPAGISVPFSLLTAAISRTMPGDNSPSHSKNSSHRTGRLLRPFSAPAWISNRTSKPVATGALWPWEGEVSLPVIRSCR